jgi:hypothetical protein
VDFDNSLHHFTYLNGSGSGAFDFLVVNDLFVSKNSDNATDLTPYTLFGQIQNATFNPAVDADPNADPNAVAAVPEPGSLVLLATGLTAVGLRIRKSVRKS